MMSELVKWLNAVPNAHPVLVSGIAQFQLVHIHPFVDGNGRTSRLLSTLCLYRSGYDFKRLFTLSEFYDRDRPAFYTAIQGVRDNNMDLTGWLEYFVTGLATQMQETQEHGRHIIKADLIAREHGLNERQMTAIVHLMEHHQIDIQTYQNLCPDVTRRTLGRDLKVCVEKRILTQKGHTNASYYTLNKRVIR